VSEMTLSGPAATQAGTPTDLADLRAAIKALGDKDAIREALYRYCSGADRSDLELMRSAYHPDAHDDHGDIFQGLGWDLATDSVRRNRASESRTLHTLSNISIDLDGDVAYVESYVVAYHFETGAEGTQAGYVFGGRYVDRFECRDSDWRIAERTAVHDWSRVEPGMRALPAGQTFVQGRRSAEDARYRRTFERA
jgi:SnoaL-like domain